MSGSEFERETIVAGMLSATADSKAADAAHDASFGPHTPELHTWRPQAEGLYDLQPGERRMDMRVQRAVHAMPEFAGRTQPLSERERRPDEQRKYGECSDRQLPVQAGHDDRHPDDQHQTV